VSLRALDKGLAAITWTVAAVLALMLLIGPKVIADDKGKPPAAGASPYAGTAASAAPDGKALFKSSCGSCHTLSAAGTNGQVGPKLDGLGVDAVTVKAVMKAGPGAMPSFSSLPPAQRDAIVKFVVASSR
jgi:mono/diheme cytochrome c family protein